VGKKKGGFRICGTPRVIGNKCLAVKAIDGVIFKIQTILNFKYWHRSCNPLIFYYTFLSQR
jgi:hypothetical protein